MTTIDTARAHLARTTAARGGFPARIWTMNIVRSRCVEEGDCWLWQQACTSTGYPWACIDGRGQSVRTWVYTKGMGKHLPSGHSVVARCRNRTCCSPLCLMGVSPGRRMEMTYADGSRSSPAESMRLHRQATRQGWTRLNADQVREVMALAGTMSAPAAGKLYGVSRSTVRDIWRGHTWQHVTRGATQFPTAVARTEATR